MPNTRLHHILRYVLFALCVAAASRATAENHSDIWWNPAESGQGLIVIDHETDLFVVWCTYDWSMPMWFVVPGGKLSADRRSFEGTLYEVSSGGDGDVHGAGTIALGTARIDFAPPDLAPGWARFTVAYTVTSPAGEGTFNETHELTRQPFGTAAPAWGADSTDMWWDPQNPGWGVATIQHGPGAIFGVLLTYDRNGNPTWFALPTQPDTEDFFIGGLVFAGDVYETTFTGMHSALASSRIGVQKAGSAWMTFMPATVATRIDFSTDVGYVKRAKLRRLPFGVTQ
jgi:hypothetical protein